ncbi:hypothetical protein [Lysobacter gummosus]|uniref:hypothetical protein n=1 Tax=Lysobacter gummosus TaxID=262324 RepID=UPI003638288C
MRRLAHALRAARTRAAGELTRCFNSAASRRCSTSGNKPKARITSARSALSA